MIRIPARLICAMIAVCASGSIALHAHSGIVAQSREGEERRSEREGHHRGLFPRFAGQAVLLCMSARVMERDRVESWTESRSQITILGHPVELKLIGANIVVIITFTPYMRHGESREKFLVAQGQIWTNTPGQGMRYHASIQTIPMEFGETIFFFPLGPVREDAASIEVMLTMYPYEEE